MAFQSFNHLEDCRANMSVLQGQIHDLNHLLPIGVGILATSLGPAFINGTIVIVT